MTRRRHGPPPRGSRQDGFVLLTVIAVLLVLVMLAAAAAATTDRVRDDQIRDDQLMAGQIDGFSTRATVLYLLATQRLTFGGLTVDDRVRLTAQEQAAKDAGEDVLSNMPVGNELRLDGTAYHGLGDTVFALQADSGRLSINWSNPLLLQRWLERLKVPAQEQGPLLARLADYQDANDLYRLNGAEAEQYRKANRPPPPDRPLATALELRQVLGWDKALEGLDDRQLLDTVTVARSAQICINTAPASVLELLPGVTPDMAQRVVALRQVQPIYQPGAVQELLPSVPEGADLVNLHPGVSGTIEVWPGGKSAGWLLHWTLTPFDDGGRPWRIDYEIRSPARPRGGHTPVWEAATPLLSHAPAADAP